MYSAPKGADIALFKFTAGFLSDIAAQKTVNGFKTSINWWEASLSGATNVFGLNAYTGAAISNSVQMNTDNKPVFPWQNGSKDPNKKFDWFNYSLNTLIGGGVGAGSNKLFPNVGPVKGAGFFNILAQTAASSIISHVGGSASGAATNAITTASRDDSSESTDNKKQ